MGVMVVRLSFNGNSSASKEGRKEPMAMPSIALVVVLDLPYYDCEDESDDEDEEKSP